MVELAARHVAGELSFQQARGFTLDEYVGLPADHPERYRNVIDAVFVSRVDFADGAVQGPDGLAADIPASCAARRTPNPTRRISQNRATRSAGIRRPPKPCATNNPSHSRRCNHP